MTDSAQALDVPIFWPTVGNIAKPSGHFFWRGQGDNVIMNCYEIFSSQDAASHGMTFGLSLDKNTPVIPKEGQKTSYYLKSEFGADWRLTKETKCELQRMYVLIDPSEDKPLPDLWGAFSPIPFKHDNGGPNMISPAMQDVLAELIPGLYETVPAGPIIDRTHGREITDHGHVFVSFLDERDTLDQDKSEIVELKRHGTDLRFNHVQGAVINARKIADGVIWREAVNGQLLVSDRFKQAFEKINGKGVGFYAQKMSNA